MATIDLLTNDPRKKSGTDSKTGVNTLSVRHPEKAHRPDNPIQKKPDILPTTVSCSFFTIRGQKLSSTGKCK